MAVTKKQLAANRRNAKKSTGPKTPGGKARVSKNAVKHGILSTALILPGEDVNEYQELLDRLISSQRVSDPIQQATIEKIAINLWKQRRQLRAESAEIELQNQSDHIARMCTEHLGCEDIPVTATELDRTDKEHETFYKPILKEFQAISKLEVDSDVWVKMKEMTPNVYRLLQEVSDSYISANRGGIPISDYDLEGIKYISKSFEKRYREVYIRRSDVQELAEKMRDKCQILQGDKGQIYNRYQTALNNEFSKYVNTLRDLKKMQSSLIDSTAVLVDTD